MKDLVIDCSVAAKWLFREKGSKQAEHILRQFSSFLVPDLFFIEMDAVISKKVRKKELSTKKASDKNKKVRELSLKIVKYAKVNRLAFDIAISLPVTLYDATYVASAIENEAVLYTADQRLVNGLSNTSLKNYVKSI